MGDSVQGLHDLVHLLAKLRQIPLAKVLRNVAKDFVQAGYMDTPKARKFSGKNPFALLPGKGRMAGKAVKVNLDKYRQEVEARLPRNFRKPRPKSRHLSRLEAYRLRRPMFGFALSAWIPAMQDLGFKKKSPPGAAKWKTVKQGFTLFAKSSGGYSDSFRKDVEEFRRARTADSILSSAMLSGGLEHPVITISVHEPSLDRYPDWEQNVRKMGMALAGARLIRGLQKCISSKDPTKLAESNL